MSVAACGMVKWIVEVLRVDIRFATKVTLKLWKSQLGLAPLVNGATLVTLSIEAGTWQASSIPLPRPPRHLMNMNTDLKTS